MLFFLLIMVCNETDHCEQDEAHYDLQQFAIFTFCLYLIDWLIVNSIAEVDPSILYFVLHLSEK